MLDIVRDVAVLFDNVSGRITVFLQFLQKMPCFLTLIKTGLLTLAEI